MNTHHLVEHPNLANQTPKPSTMNTHHLVEHPNLAHDLAEAGRAIGAGNHDEVAGCKLALPDEVPVLDPLCGLGFGLGSCRIKFLFSNQSAI
jgi:hypothetical protein